MSLTPEEEHVFRTSDHKKPPIPAGEPGAYSKQKLLTASNKYSVSR
ncbi:hypothetical protein [Halodesulfovibrio aestuarii]|uniref:Uncharacterized protein n=1 Tax=Halodesulfovibrio aestuarii TaxID=126333 RepID=A0ABV4JWH8_9BACT